MTTLDPADGHLVLINTFQVRPERAEELLRVLHEAAAVMRELPGFVSANLHRSEDGTRVVNYAQWRSKADHAAMMGTAEAQPHLKAAGDLAESYEPVFYALRHSDGVDAG